MTRVVLDGTLVKQLFLISNFRILKSLYPIAMDVSVIGASMTMADGVDFEVDSATFSSCYNATDILQFNFSQYDYPGEDGFPWPPPLGAVSALKIIFCIINIIVSILGNCAVIIAVYHNPALRSTINFYLVSEGLLFSNLTAHILYKKFICLIYSAFPLSTVCWIYGRLNSVKPMGPFRICSACECESRSTDSSLLSVHPGLFSAIRCLSKLDIPRSNKHFVDVARS